MSIEIAAPAGSLHGLFDISSGTKRDLLRRLGVQLSFEDILLECGVDKQIDALLQVARIHVLSKAELYFLQDPTDLRQPIGRACLRNEAAAVSLLLSYLDEGEQAEPARPGSSEQQHLANGGGGTAAPPAAAPAAGGSSPNAAAAAESKAALRGQLLRYCEQLWPEFASGDLTLASHQQLPLAVAPPPDSAPAAFERWAGEQGVGAAVGMASFGALRGCAALRDIAPGDKVLSLPIEALIYDDTVAQTDLGRMLGAIPGGLSTDNLLLIWTLIDRHDPDSKWALYWPSLPDKYFTGLSFPEELVGALEGTAAGLELRQAQAHLRQQYADTRPLLDKLLEAYPSLLKPEWFDYESYLWAAELWYSYAFEIEFPPEPAVSGAGAAGAAAAAAASGGGGGGDDSAPASKYVMVPFACHINHSPWPHVVRYGRVNPQTRTLDYPAFRPCPKGQQVFISYGPVANLKLLCYYGFALSTNPHDEVALTLQLPEGPLQPRQAAVLAALGLGLDHTLSDGPLARQLLAVLRVVVASSEELRDLETAAPHAAGDSGGDGSGWPGGGGSGGGDKKKKKKKHKNKGNKARGGGRSQAVGAARPGAAGTGSSGSGMLRWSDAAPLGRPVNAENESQALSTLEAFLRQLLEPLRRSPLLHEAARERPEQQAAADAPAETAGGSRPGNSSNAPGNHTAAGLGHQQQEQQQLNENGFDADWRMSRHFCSLYVRGQLVIVERALKECRQLIERL